MVAASTSRACSVRFAIVRGGSLGRQGAPLQTKHAHLLALGDGAEAFREGGRRVAVAHPHQLPVGFLARVQDGVAVHVDGHAAVLPAVHDGLHHPSQLVHQ